MCGEAGTLTGSSRCAVDARLAPESDAAASPVRGGFAEVMGIGLVSRQRYGCGTLPP